MNMQSPRQIVWQEFSESDFWNKVARFARSAGRELIERALQLYYTAQSPTTPAWAKRVIYGALAYFILPLDAIPDFIPVAGFSDDLAALLAAFTAVAAHITPEIREKAREAAERWFGDR